MLYSTSNKFGKNDDKSVIVVGVLTTTGQLWQSYRSEAAKFFQTYLE